MIRVSIRSFSAGALLRIGCLGLGTFWLLIGLFFGALALTGIAPVTLNESPTYGIAGFFGGLLIGAMFAGIFTLVFMVGGLIARYIPKVRDAGIEIRDELPPEPQSNEAAAR